MSGEGEESLVVATESFRFVLDVLEQTAEGRKSTPPPPGYDLAKELAVIFLAGCWEKGYRLTEFSPERLHS